MAAGRRLDSASALSSAVTAHRSDRLAGRAGARLGDHERAARQDHTAASGMTFWVPNARYDGSMRGPSGTFRIDALGSVQSPGPASTITSDAQGDCHRGGMTRRTEGNRKMKMPRTNNQCSF
jgi:hypothetical protein